MSEIVITSKSKNNLSIKELWEYRDLFYFLSTRDIKVKYRQTVIGIAWAIFQPLTSMIIFTLFFNKFAGVSAGEIPYTLFSYSGLIFWNFFSANINDVSNSLISNSSIITKVYFPKIIIPVTSMASGIIDFVFSASFFLIIMIFYRHIPTFIDIIAILVGLIITGIFVFGLGAFFSVINVKYRDVRYVLPFFIQLLLFATPIIYPISSVPKNIAWILYLNPVTGVLDLVRGTIFSQVYNVNYIFISILSTVIIFLFGVAWFNRYVRDVADII
jgi:lipopolysaccharide transport system permease protein